LRLFSLDKVHSKRIKENQILQLSRKVTEEKNGGKSSITIYIWKTTKEMMNDFVTS
jgi:predicted RecA/RadA family phage recombinase